MVVTKRERGVVADALVPTFLVIRSSENPLESFLPTTHAPDHLDLPHAIPLLASRALGLPVHYHDPNLSTVSTASFTLSYVCAGIYFSMEIMIVWSNKTSNS